MVPAAVVDRRRRGEGRRRSRPDAEHDAAVVAQVDVAVVARAGPVVVVGPRAVAEPDDLAAAGRGGVDPGLDRVLRRTGLARLGVQERGVLTGEGDGGAAVLGRPGCVAPDGARVVAAAVPTAERGGVHARGLVAAQVDPCTVGDDLGRVRRGHGGHGPRAGPALAGDVARLVTRGHAVGVALTGDHGRVDVLQLRPVPVRARAGHGADRRRAVVAVDVVEHRGVVLVDAGAPGDDVGRGGVALHDRGAGDGRRGHVGVGREAGQAALRGRVDARELATGPQVVLAALRRDRHGARTDALADAVVAVGRPVDPLLVRRRLRREVVPLTVLEHVLARAVVAVAGGVQDALVGDHGLVGAEAAVAPALLVRAPVERRAAVPHATAGALGADVEAVLVDCDALDDGRAVPLAGAGAPGDEALGVAAHEGAVRVEHGERVRLLAVDLGEAATHEHVAVGGVHVERQDLLGGGRGEGQHGAGRGGHGREPGTQLTVDGGEQPTEVDPGVGRRERVHRPRRRRREAPHDRAGRQVDGGDVAARDACHGGERAADVHGPPVGCRHGGVDGAGLGAVADRRCARGGATGRGVEDGQAGALDGGRVALRRAGRSQRREAASGDDQAGGGRRQCAYRAVGLPGGQVVGREPAGHVDRLGRGRENDAEREAEHGRACECGGAAHGVTSGTDGSRGPAGGTLRPRTDMSDCVIG